MIKYGFENFIYLEHFRLLMTCTYYGLCTNVHCKCTNIRIGDIEEYHKGKLSEVGWAMGHKGHMPLMKQMREAYDPL